MDKLAKIVAAACGAVLSFITGLPPLMWVLLGVMCLDYVTGLMWRPCRRVAQDGGRRPFQ